VSASRKSVQPISLVAVTVRLNGPCCNIPIWGGVLTADLCELGADFSKVKRRALLVEVLGQRGERAAPFWRGRSHRVVTDTSV
jgi:hypothetical protein